MAGGWVADGAVQEQIDRSVEDAVARARSQLPKGDSLSHCAQCGDPISQARRLAIKGVRLCLACQVEDDRQQLAGHGYNRRASKDSQLR